MLAKSGNKIKPINFLRNKRPSLIIYLKKVRFLKSQILSILEMFPICYELPICNELPICYELPIC